MLTEQTILDHGYCKHIEHWGSDERIIEAARMSTGKGFLGWGPKHAETCELSGDVKALSQPCENGCADVPGDEKLLAYLWQNKHATPFEMAGIVIEVQAPILVFREWHRHRTQCLSGGSMICCVTPRGISYKRSIRNIFDLKHGGVLDTAPMKHKNGYSKIGTPVLRDARRKDVWRTRVLPNCQSRLLSVLDEATGEFLTANMADVWESGVKEVHLLDTVKGFSIRASAEHPFFTERGWVKMKNIEAGDRVARMGKVAAHARPIPPALRAGIGVWTSMMRSRLIGEEARCYLCGKLFQLADLILDHVIPVSKSLITALDERNLKPACTTCSRSKTDSEQPSRIGMSRRGIRWEKVREKPVAVGEEMTYDIEVDGLHHNYVANDLVVHNSYNEMSARYTPLPDLNYIPTVERLMMNSKTNRQAGTIKGAAELTKADAELFQLKLRASYSDAEELYQWALQSGVPKELARVHLPVGRYSRMRASANLRNWLAFLTLRMAPSAQWEIRQFANAVGEIVQQLYPRTWALFSA